MRCSDREKLQEAYPNEHGHPDQWLRDALDLACPAVETLSKEVLADFDEQVFGIGWWERMLGAKRRILISDCLYQAIQGIADNLLEARLHVLEHADSCDQVTKIMENSATGKLGAKPGVKHPRPKRALDQLPMAFATLHVIGTTRALNSALDCLAGAMVGVAGIPQDIQRADFGRVLSFLSGRRKKHGRKPNDAQRAVHLAIQQAKTNAGPEGWLDWLRAFRNMTVHRGRRLHTSHLVRRKPVLFGPTGEDLVRVDAVPVLPAQPGWSEIQAFLGPGELLLTEPSSTTLRGMLGATRRFIDEVAGSLLDLWRRRRQDPNLIEQPESQWPRPESRRPAGFRGFEPGTAPESMDTLVAGDALIKRVRAAALEINNRHLWDTEFE